MLTIVYVMRRLLTYMWLKRYSSLLKEICTTAYIIRPIIQIRRHLISIHRLIKYQGRPQDLAGGGKKFFSSDLEICMSQSDMLRMSKPCALLGVFGGMLPRENFFKMVRFGVYFDQILSLKNFNNYHFLYKNLKNCIFFYIKEE